jgi:hypothetical protein
MRWFAALLLAALALPAAAMFQLRDGWAKWYVNASDAQSQAVAADVGGEWLAGYPLRSLVYTPSASALAARLAELHLTGGPVDFPDTVGSIDPRIGIPATVPAEMRTLSYAPGTRGLWLMQTVGPMTDGWRAAVATAGFQPLSAGYVPYNGAVYVGTPEDAARVRELPFVQYLDVWYPFQRIGVMPAYEPEQRVLLQVEVPEAYAAEARAQIAALALMVLPQTNPSYIFAVVKQADLLAVLRTPLVFLADAQLAQPRLDAVVPRSARGGDTIIISGTFGNGVTSVTIAGAASPHVVPIDHDRVSAEVPPGLPDGPADIVVTDGDGSSQMLPGFSIGPASRRTFSKGDLLSVDFVPFCCFEGGTTAMSWTSADGLRMRLGQADNIIVFDPAGRLLGVRADGSRYYDAGLHSAGAAPSYFDAATAVVFDRDGNSVAALRTTSPARTYLERRKPDGTLLTTVSLTASAFSIDLAADQCTLYLPGFGVRRYDVCAGTPLTPLVPAGSFLALTVLPSGDVLTLRTDGVLERYRSDGTRVSSVDAASATAMAISADGTFVWVGNWGSVRRYDLATNTLVAGSTPWIGYSTNLVVYGGWTAARGFVTYADDPVIASVDFGAGGAVMVHGGGFVAGTTVTVNGVTLIIDELTSTLIRGHLPAGTQGGVVTVSTPNGQTTTAAAGAAVPALGTVMLLLLAAALVAVAMRR